MGLALSVCMARKSRNHILVDGCIFSITWKCHNNDWLLKEDWAKEKYYSLLLKYKDKYKISIFSYNLMENHPHVLGFATHVEWLSKFMQEVNSQFAKAYNRRMQRCGQVVMDRYKSKMVQSEVHLINSMYYNDLNGVRCGRDRVPEDAKWSSYGYYAHGHDDPLITAPESYLDLGKTPKQRQKNYRKRVEAMLFEGRLNPSNIHFIGDPDWVKAQYEKLRREMKKKEAKLRKKQKIKQFWRNIFPPPS
jgi:REP element-mobilizing transposase RayT